MKKLFISAIVLLLALSFALGGCAPAPAEQAAPAATQEQAAPPEATAAPVEQPTAEPVAQGPQPGGTMVVAVTMENNTEDIQKMAGWGTLENLLNGTLVAYDPATSQYAPWLAESWTTSADGLTYEFKLRQDVKFSNGDPVTAADWVYTIQRALDPETASPASATMWTVSAYEAVDDYTLKLTLPQANYAFLLGLTYAPAGPVSKRAIEELGATYDRNPVGTGPYIFKEWQTGIKTVIEANPDYTWGPAWVHSGPPYIQTIEFRFMPEYATALAGMQSGEIDLIDTPLMVADIPTMSDDGRFQLFELPQQGMRPFVGFNVSKPPFDDIRVRKAFWMAADRDSLVAAVLQGIGRPLYGPIDDATIGYDPIVETLGYHYDLEQAKALMQEAGYTYDSDGMLVTPDGQPFVMDFPIMNILDYAKVAEVMSEQYKALGVTLNIILEEYGVAWTRLVGGDYQITISGLGYNDADIMYIGLHSSMIGAVNAGRVNDPVLDEILNRTRNATDPTVRQAAVTEAQKYIIEQAYIAPLYTAINYVAFSNRIQGLIYAPASQTFWFEDAYIVEP